jgi:hypothetical protein
MLLFPLPLALELLLELLPSMVHGSRPALGSESLAPVSSVPT